MPRDPVCGMNVSDYDKSIRSDFKGQTYHFCSDRCRDAFEKDPQVYTDLPDDDKPHRQSKRKNKDQEHRPLT
ncbi:MAG TPA: YHS domain-containing protein [Firmicutes bacterium]|nr:YHS domain-containing protein [Candidatus Fermentithermobacillaceae bacterium]